MFAKTKLATAVAAAFGVSAVGIQTAQADSVFFPYVASSPVVATIVSTVNTSRANYDQVGIPIPENLKAGAYLHYRIYTKKLPSATELLDPCDEFDTYLPTSWNDLQSIDIGNEFGDAASLGVLFNDASFNNNWKAVGQSFALAEGLGTVRGYMTVENADNTQGSTLRGEAFIFQFGDGAAFGYQAFDNDADGNFPQLDYSNVGTINGLTTNILPPDEFNTAFFVTPLSVNMGPDSNNKYRAAIELASSNKLRGDVYDRDERLISGTVPVPVVCVGKVQIKTMLTDGAYNVLKAQGGWAGLYSYREKLVGSTWTPALFDSAYTGTDDATSLLPQASAAAAKVTGITGGATILKLEYNAGGTFNGQPVGGIYNNGYILKGWE